VTSTMPAAGEGRQRLLVLGAICAVVVIAALVLPRILSGGGGEAEGGDVTAAPPTTVPDDDAAGGAAAVDELPAVPEATFSTKNPFTPLVDTGAAAAQEVGDTASGSTTDLGDETSDVPPDSASATTDDTDDPAVEPDRAAARLSIVEIYAGPDGAPVATVEVDGAMVTVTEGEAFGGGYVVVSLSEASGTGVFSRDGERFTVREGEARLK
jgi:hypothetical protein